MAISSWLVQPVNGPPAMPYYSPPRISRLVSRFLLLPSLDPGLDRCEGWRGGPADVVLGDSGCRLGLALGQSFADSETTQMVMEAIGNQPSGLEVGLVPLGEGGAYLLLEYDDIGYLDDRLLEVCDRSSLFQLSQRATDKANRYRRKLGLAPACLSEWLQPPEFDQERHVVTWSLLADQGNWRRISNSTWCFLSIGGSVTVTLVSPHARYRQDRAAALDVMEQLDFSEGHRYADYRRGDRTAFCGLGRWLEESFDLTGARVPAFS